MQKPPARILTLCYGCAKSLGEVYRLNRIPTQTTTEKQPKCEQCRKKFSKDALDQYTIAAKSKK